MHKDQKNNGDAKSDRRVGWTMLFLGITLLFFIGFFIWFLTESFNWENKERDTLTKSVEPKHLTIETTKPANSGSITIYDSDGDIYYQYAGDINIVNNGKNGEDIEIVVQLPDSGTCYCEPTYEMPMNIVLYDRTNMAIAQYSAYPELQNGTLRLLDADLLYIEHDFEWDDMVETE